MYNSVDKIIYNQDRTAYAVLYSKAYKYHWNVKDKNIKKMVMFFEPLISYLLNGGNSRDLVNEKNELTEKGKEIFGDFFDRTNKRRHSYEDVKNIDICWIPVKMKFRITEYGGYEKIEYYDDDEWFFL